MWIDVKSEVYIKDLVALVHNLTPDGTPYSIVYNLTKDTGSEVMQWLVENMRDNEALNYGDCDVNTVQAYTRGQLPANKQFYTKGYFRLSGISRTSYKANEVRKAQALQRNGEFCLRTGMWTANKAFDGYFWLHNFEESKNPTDFDVILIYCEGGFHIPMLNPKYTLKRTMERYFNKRAAGDGLYVAKRNEPFIHK